MHNHSTQISVSIALFCIALLGCSDEVQQSPPEKEVAPSSTVKENSPEISELKFQAPSDPQKIACYAHGNRARSHPK